jgi:hypothetical protein
MKRMKMVIPKKKIGNGNISPHLFTKVAVPGICID